MAILDQDTFVRANQSGFGTASGGSSWTFTGHASTNAIISNEGNIKANANNDTHGQLGSGTAGDQEVICRISFDDIINDVGGIQARFSSAAGTTCIKILYYSFSLNLNKMVAGAFTNLASTGVWTPISGAFYWFKLRCVGTNFYAKVWADDGTGEPTAWTLTATDSAVTSGGWGILAGTSSTNGVSFDHFQANDALQTATGTPYAVVGTLTPFVDAGSLSIQGAIARRSTASLNVKTDAPMFFPEDTPVSIYDQNAALIFAGYLTAPEYNKPGFQKKLYHRLQAADKHRLADKRRIAGVFNNFTGAYIAQWIIDNYLVEEGITAGQIYDGGTVCSDTLYCGTGTICGEAVGLISTVVFDYCKASEGYDQIVKSISSSGTPYYWQINYDSTLDLIPYDAIVNASTIDGSQIDEVVNPPKVTRSNPAYRNGQIIKGGTVQTVPQPETRIGDSNTQSWPMSYALSTAPTITVNTVAKTVGIRGVDTGKDFYWAKGEKEITQDSAATKLTSGQTLAVTYIGQYPSVAIVYNDAQVALEASIDGSSGKVEEVETIALDSLDAQLNIAGARLTRYAVQSPPVFDFSTRQTGYAPGQFVPVDLPDYSLSQSMLIESITADDSTDGFNIWYHIHCISGPSDTSWAAFWGEITGSGPASDASAATTTIVTTTQAFSVAIGVAYAFTPVVTSCHLCSSSTFCGNAVLVC